MGGDDDVTRDAKRRFTKAQRTAAYLTANGKCESCGTELGRGWECDHVEEWADGGVTQTYNARALCRDCHRRKTNAERIRRTS